MKHWSRHGSLWPRALSRAMTSVAASSTTAAPLRSNRRRTAVFPAPGAPVRMYLIIANSLDLNANGMTKWDEQVGRRRQAEYRDPEGAVRPDALLRVKG